jgi:hypothetical protein
MNEDQNKLRPEDGQTEGEKEEMNDESQVIKRKLNFFFECVLNIIER